MLDTLLQMRAKLNSCDSGYRKREREREHGGIIILAKRKLSRTNDKAWIQITQNNLAALLLAMYSWILHEREVKRKLLSALRTRMECAVDIEAERHEFDFCFVQQQRN